MDKAFAIQLTQDAGYEYNDATFRKVRFVNWGKRRYYNAWMTKRSDGWFYASHDEHGLFKITPR